MTYVAHAQTLLDLERYRRSMKAKAILADETHPQHTLLVDLLDTAIALDPPEGWDQDPPAARPTTAEGSEHSTMPTPIGRNPR